MDPTLSSCCDFLLKLLFLVRTIKDIGGAVREPRARVIGLSLRRGRDLFFEAIFGTHVSLKIVIFEENGSQNGPKMKTLGSYFSEKV